jgi:hypothetical protein
MGASEKISAGTGQSIELELVTSCWTKGRGLPDSRTIYGVYEELCQVAVTLDSLTGHPSHRRPRTGFFSLRSARSTGQETTVVSQLRGSTGTDPLS